METKSRNRAVHEHEPLQELESSLLLPSAFGSPQGIKQTLISRYRWNNKLLLYKNVRYVGEHLTKVIEAIFEYDNPTESQRTVKMIFANKPNKINSIAKSYIYQDMLEKPEELILYRQEHDGGLGLENVGIKAQAMKIKNFLQMEANPKYTTNIVAKTTYDQ